MPFERGDVVLVPFPFTDLSRQKLRPAVVVSTRRFNEQSPDVILVALSSQVMRTLAETDLVIQHDTPGFPETGLRVSSVARVGKLVTLQQSLVTTRLGRLDDTLLEQIDARLAVALGLEAR